MVFTSIFEPTASQGHKANRRTQKRALKGAAYREKKEAQLEAKQRQGRCKNTSPRLAHKAPHLTVREVHGFVEEATKGETCALRHESDLETLFGRVSRSEKYEAATTASDGGSDIASINADSEQAPRVLGRLGSVAGVTCRALRMRLTKKGPQKPMTLRQGFGNAAESNRLQRHRPFVPLLSVSGLVPDLDFNVQNMKFDRAMCRRTKLSFKCSEYRSKTANENHKRMNPRSGGTGLGRYNDKRSQKPPQAHRAARVATRTCLALGVVEEASDMPVLVGHGPGHTCVSKLLRRATTLEGATEARGSPMDCFEDPSLFDLTKAMVDPEPNAEFSLCGDLSSPVCEVCTGELPCSRRLHVSAKLDNMCDFPHSEMDDGAVADVFAFENLPCPVPSTWMSTDNEDDPLTAKLVAENERLHAALAEARRENAELAIQRTEHVDFAHLLELAKEFGDGFGGEVDSFLDPLCSGNIPHFDMSSADAEVAQLKCELQDSRLEVARLRAQLASHGIGRTAGF